MCGQRVATTNWTTYRVGRPSKRWTDDLVIVDAIGSNLKALDVEFYRGCLYLAIGFMLHTESDVSSIKIENNFQMSDYKENPPL